MVIKHEVTEPGRFILNARVRFSVQSPGAEGVELSLVGTPARKWLVPANVAHAVAHCARIPTSRSAIVVELAKYASLPETEARALANQLIEGGVLVDPNEDAHVRATRLANDWARFGWTEAADYHLATFDYPFIDYAKAEESRKDVILMRQYSRAEPDTDRTKELPPGLPRISCPPLKESLSQLATPLGSQQCIPRSATTDARALGIVLTASMGVRGTRPTKYANAAPLLLKTVPSGGARHPTECYVLPRKVHGVPDGIYAYVGVENALVRIGEPFSDFELQDLLPGVQPVPGVREVDPLWFFVLSSKTSRNRYRYREPRTFRTVFMDVGHLIANLELASASLGISTFFSDEIDGPGIDARLDLDSYEESVLFAGVAFVSTGIS